MAYKHNITNEVGPAIKAYLDNHGIMQKFVADQIVMKIAAFNARMNGYAAVTAEELFAICNILGVPVETFKPANKKEKTA